MKDIYCNICAQEIIRGTDCVMWGKQEGEETQIHYVHIECWFYSIPYYIKEGICNVATIQPMYVRPVFI